jgi:hypothetical protein
VNENGYCKESTLIPRQGRAGRVAVHRKRNENKNPIMNPGVFITKFSSQESQFSVYKTSPSFLELLVCRSEKVDRDIKNRSTMRRCIGNE